jgi:hypothetical protein
LEAEHPEFDVYRLGDDQHVHGTSAATVSDA